MRGRLEGLAWRHRNKIGAWSVASAGAPVHDLRAAREALDDPLRALNRIEGRARGLRGRVDPEGLRGDPVDLIEVEHGVMAKEGEALRVGPFLPVTGNAVPVGHGRSGRSGLDAAPALPDLIEGQPIRRRESRAPGQDRVYPPVHGPGNGVAVHRGGPGGRVPRAFPRVYARFHPGD